MQEKQILAWAIGIQKENCVVPENIHTPPTEGIFHMAPPPPPPPNPLWIFQSQPTKYPPPPPPEIPIFRTPPGNISISS